MPAKRINQLVTDLPFERKLLGAGALLMAISTFMPWYRDLDSFKTGDVFIGLSGPLYLVGFTILAMSIINILLVFVEASDKKLPISSIKPASFFLASGLVSFYLLMVVNAVYFHNKFGVNITMKESQFGMFMAFIAASLITIGGYLATREKSSILKEFQEKAQEALIKIPELQDTRKAREITRPAPMRSAPPAPAPIAEKVTQTQIAEDIVAQYSAAQHSSAELSQAPRQQAPSHAAHTAERKTFQPYRSDL